MARLGRRVTASLTVGVLGLLAARAALGRARTMSFRGARVLITGGSRGLGLLLAREFGAQDARVAICARDAGELERATADLHGRGITALPLRGDVADAGQVEGMIREVIDRWGGIDVLVNNAGIITVGPVETMTLADYQNAMAVNFWGGLHAILAVLPSMRERGSGRIVNITSIGGKISVPHLSPYSASKFAFVGLSEGLRAELARDGILVTTVCPGLMRTGSPRNADFKGQHQAEYAWFSISDALPGVSMDAERAARRIVRACARGDAELILSAPAKVAARVQGLVPGLVGEVLTVVNRLLPAAGGIGRAAAKGYESESALSPSWLTRMGDTAAARHNELGGGERRA
jgi:NAD(P)-dependent dehydrogenase (short-subunit alcohol dehydrogenase family)